MSDPAPKAIFLSYARDDAAAARRLAEALRSAGLDVWFDENELRGGDAWDTKIRRQITDCALFLPIISQHTEARAKGYFRLEWKLAVDQTHLMADGIPFLAPVVIDDTKEAGASVPAEFLRVQWTRLPGALPTPQFVEQLNRLLAAPAKPSAPSVARAFQPGDPDDTGLKARATKSRLPIAAWIATAVIVLGVIATFLARRSPAPASPPIAGVPVPTPAIAPVSEARQLVAKARALYEPWDLATPDDFLLAEDLLKRAVGLDPSDAEAWTAYALVACGQRTMLDFSDTWSLAARSRAEKAIKLAPDSPQARFAWAYSLRFDPQTRDDAIRLLREEATRQPTNRVVVRTLGAALRAVGELEQSLVYFGKAAALPGNDPITHYNRGLSLERLGRFDEAEAAFDEALALAPRYPSANWSKLNLLLDIRRDLPRAKAHLAKIPPDPIVNQANALTAYQMAVYLRDPARALKVLSRANDFLVGIGPKATLTALAHRMARNEDAARTDLKAALRLVEERLTAQPNDTRMLANKAEILALQGDRTAAEPLVRDVSQRIDAGDWSVSKEQLAYLFMMVNQPDAALTALESSFVPATRGYNSKIGLRYDPAWDPLRGNPRFEALLKDPEPKR